MIVFNYWCQQISCIGLVISPVATQEVTIEAEGVMSMTSSRNEPQADFSAGLAVPGISLIAIKCL